MGAVTWGLNGKKEATVFCMRCRAVFGKELEAVEAVELIRSVESNHHCTPPKPWRPHPAGL